MPSEPMPRATVSADAPASIRAASVMSPAMPVAHSKYASFIEVNHWIREPRQGAAPHGGTLAGSRA